VPLKSDQRAMLQLLLERDQSYGDLASVLGVKPDEVHERARAALAELGGSDPDADVGLTDYLLGQADPIGRADAVRHLQSDPEALGLAEKVAAQLQLLAPDAELPQLPRSKAKPAPAAVAGNGAPKGPAERGGRFPGAAAANSLQAWVRRQFAERRRGSIIVSVVAGAALVVAILAIAGVFGGGGGGEGGGSASAATRQGYPLSPLLIKEGKDFAQRFPIPQPALPIAAGASTIAVSLSDNSSLGPRLQNAVSSGLPVLDYEDPSVLEGDVPTSEANSGDQSQIVSVKLKPSGETDASGTAAFGIQGRQAFLDVKLDGLDPAPSGKTYVLWFLLPEGVDLAAAAAQAQSQAQTTPGGGAGGGAAPGGGGQAAPQP
jgi:hypothetical protein